MTLKEPFGASVMRAKMSRKRKRVLDDAVKESIEKAEEKERKRRAMQNRRPQTPAEWKEYNDRMARRAT